MSFSSFGGSRHLRVCRHGGGFRPTLLATIEMQPIGAEMRVRRIAAVAIADVTQENTTTAEGHSYAWALCKPRSSFSRGLRQSGIVHRCATQQPAVALVACVLSAAMADDEMPAGNLEREICGRLLRAAEESSAPPLVVGNREGCELECAVRSRSHELAQRESQLFEDARLWPLTPDLVWAARRVLGPEAAKQWWITPKIGLNGRLPCELAASGADGLDQVRVLLERMEYGIYP